LSKNSDFNHLKIKFAQKTQKCQNKSKKSANAKIKETCGDMLETNKASKGYVAIKWRQISLVKVDKVGHVF
jgi:hypothetical protein